MSRTFLLLSLLIFPASAMAQVAVNPEEEVKNLIQESFDEILSKNKKEKLSQYYTDDFILLEDGEVWDLEIIKGYMDKAAEMDQMPERINSFDFIEVKVQDSTAWTAYHNKAVFKMNGNIVGEMNWLESASAILTDEGWKLQVLHSTVIEEKE